jgi:hypothetical protein
MNQFTYNINYLSPIAGSLSGTIEVFSTHWLDRIKTEMQRTTLTNKKVTIINTIKNLSIDGLHNFYSGVIPRIIGIIPMRFIYWNSLESLNYIVKDKPIYYKYIVPGLGVGCIQTIVDNPIEVFKIKFMTKNKYDKINLTIKSLYFGFLPCMIRNCLFVLPVSICTQKFNKENEFVVGAIGGLIGALISQPFDVVKTEMQRHKSNNEPNNKMTEILIKIFNDNPKKLWTGGMMRCIMGFCTMGIGYLSFNKIKHFIKGNAYI